MLTRQRKPPPIPEPKLVKADYPPPCSEEWNEHLLKWFSQLRLTGPGKYTQQPSEISLSDIPSKENFNPEVDVTEILSIVSSKDGDLCAQDVAWIFFSLTLLGRLLDEKQANILARLLLRINLQIKKDPENKMVPHLTVVSVLISSFFHRP